MFLEKLIKQHERFDEYLTYLDRNPSDYETSFDKFIEIAKCSKERKQLSKEEIDLIEYPNFVKFYQECKSIFQSTLKCLSESISSDKFDETYYPFLFVREFTSTFPEIKTYVCGGSAQYLHILNKVGVKIGLNDIDLAINNENMSGDSIYDNLLMFMGNFCKKYDCTFKTKNQNEDDKMIGYLYLSKNGRKCTDLNFFINMSDENTETLDGMLIQDFDSVIKHVNDWFDDYKISLEYNDSDEVLFFESKLPRKKQFRDIVYGIKPKKNTDYLDESDDDDDIIKDENSLKEHFKNMTDTLKNEFGLGSLTSVNSDK